MPDVLSPEYLEFAQILPVRGEGPRTRIAAARAPARHVLEDLADLFAGEFELVAVAESDLEDALRRLRAAAEPVVELVQGQALPADADDYSPADARDLANHPPVVRFVNWLIRAAADAGASDIHLDATHDGLHTRLRLDGILTPFTAPPRGLQTAIVSRLKILSGLDIAERLAPQDGRFRVRLDQRELDLRIAVVPTHFGESVTLRLLDGTGRPVSLAGLGMPPEVLDDFTTLVRRPHGIVLVTGPTGSGKTTTLYAALALRDRLAEKVVTVEDPVEYQLDGITQLGVTERMDFSSALRTLVRLDPDVLMIGEIRDRESADVAVRAALTGHLVLATLHTNDALGAIPRLVDLGVPPWLLSATIQGVLAQRLVRCRCTECRLSNVAPASTQPGPSGLDLHETLPMGCAACRHTGFRGRTGIFELISLDDALRDEIARGADKSRLQELATERGLRPLREDGWAKVRSGITTPEEVLRVVQG